jgi:hypothetical protein
MIKIGALVRHVDSEPHGLGVVVAVFDSEDPRELCVYEVRWNNNTFALNPTRLHEDVLEVISDV